MKSVTFVTSNENKFREFQAVLGTDIRRINLELDEIQEMDLDLVVEHKVKQAYSMIKVPVVVEDVGFYLDVWKGFPGPFIKWFAQTAGFDRLPALVPKNNRNAEWVVVYGYYDGFIFKTFKGSLKGKVTLKARGVAWGFGAFFVPDGYTETMGEMGETLKNKIGARGKALQKLKKFLKEA
jgi:non-canonical purine NTP pyrophosphatase (RdgB/HAM1 family)